MSIPSGAAPALHFRSTREGELPYLESFLHEHGSNEWNYLPIDGVSDTFRSIAQGSASVLLATTITTNATTEAETVVGMGIYLPPSAFPDEWRQFVPPASTPLKMVFVAEMVVRRDFVGRGIGSRILTEICTTARCLEASAVLVDRHEENAASAGMMRNAGFDQLAAFKDDAKRPTGSRRTAVLRKAL